MSIGMKLEKLLDHEKDILLSGDLDKLETLEKVKISLSNELEDNDNKLSNDQIKRIIHKSGRNQELLKSAQRGIQSALTQLREVSEGSFQAYSREGVRAPIISSKSVGKRI